MNIEALHKWYESRHNKLLREFDVKCRPIVVSLVMSLRPRFVIEEIVCSMGTWSAIGQPFTIDYGDGVAESDNLDELFRWSRNRLIWDPVGVTDKDRRTLQKLHGLMDFWVETTGGENVMLPKLEVSK